MKYTVERLKEDLKSIALFGWRIKAAHDEDGAITIKFKDDSYKGALNMLEGLLKNNPAVYRRKDGSLGDNIGDEFSVDLDSPYFDVNYGNINIRLVNIDHNG